MRFAAAVIAIVVSINSTVQAQNPAQIAAQVLQIKAKNVTDSQDLDTYKANVVIPAYGQANAKMLILPDSDRRKMMARALLASANTNIDAATTRLHGPTPAPQPACADTLAGVVAANMQQGDKATNPATKTQKYQTALAAAMQWSTQNTEAKRALESAANAANTVIKLIPPGS